MSVKETTHWFGVDRAGLRKTVSGRDKARLVMELIQNCWDTDSPNCVIRLEATGTRGVCMLNVTDEHPTGFNKLSDAYTFFGESEKKNDPTKRGRYNIGEKLFLALCESASIKTMRGTVCFLPNDKRVEMEAHTEIGTEVTAHVYMTQGEMRDVLRTLNQLIPPPTCETSVNYASLPLRVARAKFDIALPTLLPDEEGVMRPRTRTTTVQLYLPEEDETPTLYEMGIPVVELPKGERYHINVNQKVPLNSDRDNVTPAFLRDLRAVVLNNLTDFLNEEDLASNWVNDAITSPRIQPETVAEVIVARFGEGAVLRDIRDPEANSTAAAAGVTVISPRSLGKEQWEVVRSLAPDLLPTAGKVYPTKHPQFSPDGKPPLDFADWTEDMRYIAGLAMRIARHTLNLEIRVCWYATGLIGPNAHFSAWYGDRRLSFNRSKMKSIITSERAKLRPIIDLIIHELGHESTGNHLSDNYYEALTDIGAGVAMMALEHPAFFERAHCLLIAESLR